MNWFWIKRMSVCSEWVAAVVWVVGSPEKRMLVAWQGGLWTRQVARVGGSYLDAKGRSGESSQRKGMERYYFIGGGGKWEL